MWPSRRPQWANERQEHISCTRSSATHSSPSLFLSRPLTHAVRLIGLNEKCEWMWLQPSYLRRSRGHRHAHTGRGGSGGEGGADSCLRAQGFPRLPRCHSHRGKSKRCRQPYHRDGQTALQGDGANGPDLSDSSGFPPSLPPSSTPSTASRFTGRIAGKIQ